MKSLMVATVGFLAFALPAFAQSTPTSNATALGTSTTSGNGAGMPSAGTPQGQLGSSGPGTASPATVPSMGVQPGGGVPQALHPTADSSTTGTTTAPSK